VNYIDLFSGIGGFALGAYWAGMKFDRHYFSEIDPYCVELYQKRFPDAIPLGDIKEIDCEELADAEGTGLEGRNGNEREAMDARSRQGRQDCIITGGFPCQDISVAGKGEGIGGSRSGLWFEYWRIIRDLRPRFAIMENVGALTFRGLTDVLGSLAEIGYDAEWQDIRAEDVGAPHRRERIWIVAYPNESGQQERRRPEPVREEQSASEYLGEAPNSDSERSAYEGESNAGSECCGRRDTISACGSAGGDYWAVEPSVGRLAHGIPRRVDRLRGLGNAIVPQIAQMLFEQIQHVA